MHSAFAMALSGAEQSLLCMVGLPCESTAVYILQNCLGLIDLWINISIQMIYLGATQQILLPLRSSSISKDHFSFGYSHIPSQHCTSFTICYQVMQIFECGHNNGSRSIRCRNPTSKCGGIFLRQELEEISGLCAVRTSLRAIWALTDTT
jgi:hypothetical protein